MGRWPTRLQKPSLASPHKSLPYQKKYPYITSYFLCNDEALQLCQLQVPTFCNYVCPCIVKVISLETLKYCKVNLIAQAFHFQRNILSFVIAIVCNVNREVKQLPDFRTPWALFGGSGPVPKRLGVQVPKFQFWHHCDPQNSCRTLQVPKLTWRLCQGNRSHGA